MKPLIPLFLLVTAVTIVDSAKAGNVSWAIKCNADAINNVYIPKLQEIVDWPVEMIRPYAKQLCALEKERESLQKSISGRAVEIRQTNWRVCKEVIPGNPNPTPSQCASAHNTKINNLIDKCIDLVSLGHNPHNVGLLLDPLSVEVSCLRGVNMALK